MSDFCGWRVMIVRQTVLRMTNMLSFRDMNSPGGMLDAHEGMAQTCGALKFFKKRF